MYSRFLSIVFLFTVLIAVFAAPVPEPKPESRPEDGELDLTARTLEPRGSGRASCSNLSNYATWYYPGLGACGKTNSKSENVVALSQSMYPGKCGKYITVKYKGKSVRCKVVDLCPGCGGQNIDMSPAAFQKLASLGTGVIQVTWNFS